MPLHEESKTDGQDVDVAVDNGPSSNVIGFAALFHFELASEEIVRRKDAAAVTAASLLSELINEQWRTVS